MGLQEPEYNADGVPCGTRITKIRKTFLSWSRNYIDQEILKLLRLKEGASAYKVVALFIVTSRLRMPEQFDCQKYRLYHT